MNKPRPFLTALCFVLFAAVFASSNVRSDALYCPAYSGAEAGPLRRMADDVRHLLYRALHPSRAD